MQTLNALRLSTSEPAGQVHIHAERSNLQTPAAKLGEAVCKIEGGNESLTFRQDCWKVSRNGNETRNHVQSIAGRGLQDREDEDFLKLKAGCIEPAKLFKRPLPRPHSNLVWRRVLSELLNSSGKKERLLPLELN
jgi:hypothetical protein